MGTKRLVFSVTMKDLRLDTFTVGGHGGAGKDTSNTGVRLVHEASGATGQATGSRSQLTNKRVALKRLAQTQAFHAWAQAEAARLSGVPTVEQRVEESMAPSNLVVEVHSQEGWIPWT